MPKTPTSLEKGLNDYLKSSDGNYPDAIIDAIAELDNGDSDAIHEQVEIAILPGYAKSNLDDMWIQNMNNLRLSASMYPDENLHRFFTVMNVHPREVLTTEHLTVEVARPGGHVTQDYAEWANRMNFDIVKKYFDLIANFKTDASRPPLCDAETMRIIYDNAGYGGVPIMAGWARISDILDLDFNKNILISGQYQVGIYDTMNGSGHMESATASPFSMKLDRGDLMVLSTKGWTPNHTFGFVGRYYQLDLSTVKEAAGSAVQSTEPVPA